MTFKILGIERGWRRLQIGSPRPRQVFVTQSRVLAEKVLEFYTKMARSLSEAVQTREELEACAARQIYQLGQGLFDRDEEVYQRGDLPQRYGELKDEHFPLFLTFDHVSPHDNLTRALFISDFSCANCLRQNTKTRRSKNCGVSSSVLWLNQKGLTRPP